MDQITLSAEARSETGSAASRRMRRDGRVPCVVYGDGHSETLTVGERDLMALVDSSAYVFDLAAPSGGHRVQLKEVQWDTYGDRILHADFARVKRGEAIEVNVVLRFFGTPQGVEEGGVLETPNDTLHVEGRASVLPEEIEIDVRELGLGDILRVEDLSVREGITYLDDPTTIVAHIVAPTAEVEEEGEAEPAPGEPEVISEADREEEEGETDAT